MSTTKQTQGQEVEQPEHNQAVDHADPERGQHTESVSGCPMGELRQAFSHLAMPTIPHGYPA